MVNVKVECKIKKQRTWKICFKIGVQLKTFVLFMVTPFLMERECTRGEGPRMNSNNTMKWIVVRVRVTLRLMVSQSVSQSVIHSFSQSVSQSDRLGIEPL
jgi:hypothetical protein